MISGFTLNLVMVFVISALLTAILTGYVILWLRKKAILDQPTDRSSHTVPTPRGGGWGVMPVIWLIWGGYTVWMPASHIREMLIMALIGSVVLSLISWLDDRRKEGLPASIRLIIQILSVGFPVLFIPTEARIFEEYLPLIAERGLIFFTWLWFINAFNFMDGINGLSGVQASTNAMGLALIGTLLIGHATLPILSVAISGAAIGFLVWNLRPQAAVFLGDIGSVGLGYLLGWLFLLTALSGAPLAVVIIPLYYWFDATLTLLKRLLRGEKIWTPHRQHFYQQATAPTGGVTHVKVSLIIGVLNMILVLFAIQALRSDQLFEVVTYTVAALIAVIATLIYIVKTGPATTDNQL